MHTKTLEGTTMRREIRKKCLLKKIGNHQRIWKILCIYAKNRTSSFLTRPKFGSRGDLWWTSRATRRPWWWSCAWRWSPSSRQCRHRSTWSAACTTRSRVGHDRGLPKSERYWFKICRDKSLRKWEPRSILYLEW